MTDDLGSFMKEAKIEKLEAFTALYYQDKRNRSFMTFGTKTNRKTFMGDMILNEDQADLLSELMKKDPLKRPTLKLSLERAKGQEYSIKTEFENGMICPLTGTIEVQDDE